VRPAPDEPPAARFETGTLPHESLAGFTAAVEYLRAVGWDSILPYERMLAQRFLAGLPSSYRLLGIPEADGRTPTFAVLHPDRTSDDVATALGERGIATWSGTTTRSRS
jgi:selenocysteine lyase/cysteine desulfurase